MRIGVASVVFLVAVGVGVAARAQDIPTYLTGNELHQLCTAETDNYCLGYVAGIADAMAASGGVSGSRSCPAMGVELRQVVDVVKVFLAAHPEQRHYVAADIVARALAEAFPCP